MTERPENPAVAPQGEIPGMARVLPTAQAGSPLDQRARELLGRLSLDENMDESVRKRAHDALAGRASFRDVLRVPAFAQRMEDAGRQLQAALAQLDDEQRAAVRESFITGKKPDIDMTPKGDAGAR